ncbi:hypothetical protein MASR2M15_04460 [Anaerolineales bacterium]
MSRQIEKQEMILDEMTAIILAGEDPELHAATYQLDDLFSPKEWDQTLQLIQALNHNLVSVKLSDAFVERLRQDLLNDSSIFDANNLRRLPTHVQFAAMFAIGIGALLFLYRRFGAVNYEHDLAESAEELLAG